MFRRQATSLYQPLGNVAGMAKQSARLLGIVAMVGADFILAGKWLAAHGAGVALNLQQGGEHLSIAASAPDALPLKPNLMPFRIRLSSVLAALGIDALSFLGTTAQSFPLHHLGSRIESAAPSLHLWTRVVLALTGAFRLNVLRAVRAVPCEVSRPFIGGAVSFPFCNHARSLNRCVA